MLKISLIQADITALDVDAVVNAANNNLLRGGGLCGEIYEAAGPELEGACRQIGYCETGSAVVTPGYKLKARHIIHAVGPRYFLNPDQSPSLLESAYRACLRRASELKIKSLALPCLSTGVYGYPLFPAAKIAVRTIQSEVRDLTLESVVFCCSDDETYQIYSRLLSSSPIHL